MSAPSQVMQQKPMPLSNLLSFLRVGLFLGVLPSSELVSYNWDSWRQIAVVSSYAFGISNSRVS